MGKEVEGRQIDASSLLKDVVHELMGVALALLLVFLAGVLRRCLILGVPAGNTLGSSSLVGFVSLVQTLAQQLLRQVNLFFNLAVVLDLRAPLRRLQVLPLPSALLVAFLVLRSKDAEAFLQGFGLLLELVLQDSLLAKLVRGREDLLGQVGVSAQDFDVLHDCLHVSVVVGEQFGVHLVQLVSQVYEQEVELPREFAVGVQTGDGLLHPMHELCAC